MDMKGYDAKCGYMGYIPDEERYILFPTYEEYRDFYYENYSEEALL